MKPRLLCSLLLLALSAPLARAQDDFDIVYMKLKKRANAVRGGGGGQTTLDTDAFNGTAGTALHSYNVNWINSTISAQYGDAKISTPNGSAIGSGGKSGDTRGGQTWTNDQFVQATYTTLATVASFICVRATTSAGDFAGGYCVGTNPNINGNNNYDLYNPHGFASLATSTTTAAPGDVVNLQVKGTAITVKVNGVTISALSITDSSQTTGNPAIIFDSDTTAKWSAWSAGSVN